MLHNYLTTAWRRALRHPGQTIINVFGLTAGAACCLLIFLFVRHELAFDTFHDEANRIYRLNRTDTRQGGAVEHHAVTSGLMGPALVDDFADVEAAVRVLPWFDDVVFSNGETVTKLPLVLFADRNFFEVFDFTLRRGDPATVLEAPMSVVLTPAVAEALFGEADPIGMTVIGIDDEAYTVTGIADPAPDKSHIQYEALVSWSSTVPGRGALEYYWMNNWLTQSLFTYVLLTPGGRPAAVEEGLGAFMKRHFAERAEQYSLYLQPMNDVYLRSSHVLHARKVKAGNELYVYVFGCIGLLVLFVAGVNFVNLSTARARRRIAEVGIRKSVGATRGILALQFIGEAVLVALPSVLLATAIVNITLPAFIAFTGRSIEFDALNPAMLLAIVTGALLIGAAAGAYPALTQSAYSPARALRGGGGTFSGRGGAALPRRILVAMQFAISIALLIVTTVVYRQMQFVNDAGLGYAAEQIIVLNTGGTAIEERYDAFAAQLRRHPNIAHVAAGKNIPGHGMMSFTLKPEGRPDDEVWAVPIQRIAGPEMLDTYGLKIVEGRFFSRERPSELQNGVVINEALARSLEWSEPVGKRMDVQGELAGGVVIGVVEDFHFESLHRPIDPTAFIIDTTSAGYVSARVRGEDLAGTLGYIEAQWKSLESRYPFEYEFLDDAFGSFYSSEQRLMTTLGLFAGLAVAIACLGLFGLAAFLAEERTKEIGIRKVLGASAARILVMLSTETVGLVLIAWAVAVPIAYMLAQRWLESFAYRVDVTGWTLGAAGVLVLLLSVATVSYQALRAATADPAKALRNE